MSDASSFPSLLSDVLLVLQWGLPFIFALCFHNLTAGGCAHGVMAGSGI